MIDMEAMPLSDLEELHDQIGECIERRKREQIYPKVGEVYVQRNRDNYPPGCTWTVLAVDRGEVERPITLLYENPAPRRDGHGGPTRRTVKWHLDSFVKDLERQP